MIISMILSYDCVDEYVISWESIHNNFNVLYIHELKWIEASIFSPW